MINVSKEELSLLKKEYAKSQKCGVHFITASLVIWMFILIVNNIDLSQYYKNALSLYSSALLVPLALLFSKIYKIQFSEKENPLNTAGIVFALNQMIYLLIVILVWMIRPELMVTVYAMIVGAHFLPYSWLYDSLTYRIVSIVIPILSIIFALMKWTAFTPLIVIVFDIIMITIFINKNK